GSPSSASASGRRGPTGSSPGACSPTRSRPPASGAPARTSRRLNVSVARSAGVRGAPRRGCCATNTRKRRRRRGVVRADTTTELEDALAPISDAWQAANEMRPFALVTHAKLTPFLAREAGAGPFAFVDLGCGSGTLLHALRAGYPGWRLVGVDASRGMLAVA